MESHKIPTVTFLSEKNCDKLNDLIVRLCSTQKVQALNKQVELLETNLSHIHIFDELPMFRNKLIIPAHYIKFAKSLLTYAERQTLKIPHDIAQQVMNLKKQLNLLEEKLLEKTDQIEAENEARRAIAASPRILSSKALKPTQSRTMSGLGRLIFNLAGLEKEQKVLLSKMAEVANSLLEHAMLLPVMDQQLQQLPMNEIDAYWNASLDIKCIKNITELNAYCTRVSTWLKQNDVLFMSLKDSLVMLKAIADLVLPNIPEASMKKYKALDNGKNNIRQHLPNSELCSPIINKVDRILTLQDNLSDLQVERIRQIHAKEKMKQAQNATNMLAHKRERSKSQNHLMTPGTKITFFTSQLRKNAGSHPNLRQNSSKLPTKYRKKEKRLSIPSPDAPKPSH